MRAEQAINYPFRRIFQNQTAYWKRPFNLPIFWFRLARGPEKTVRDTVNLSAGSNPPAADATSARLAPSAGRSAQ
jgi:hypothetical protein